jgi:hypothetical protein
MEKKKGIVKWLTVGTITCLSHASNAPFMIFKLLRQIRVFSW